MANQEPQARDRIVGARLRAVRTERVKLSLEQAAETAQWSPDELGQAEEGLRPVTTDEVAALVTAWGLPEAERDAVLADVEADARLGEWDHPAPGTPPAMAGREEDAYDLVSVTSGAIPELLQTHETAIATMVADGMSPEHAEVTWTARLRKQQVLGKVDYTAFIAEPVLRMPYGGARGQRAQLAHLLRVQDHGVVVRIVPERQTEVLIMHSWLRMRFHDAEPVVRVELSVSGAFYINGEDAKPYDDTLAKLDRVALSPEESRALIAGLLDG